MKIETNVRAGARIWRPSGAVPQQSRSMKIRSSVKAGGRIRIPVG